MTRQMLGYCSAGHGHQTCRFFPPILKMDSAALQSINPAPPQLSDHPRDSVYWGTIQISMRPATACYTCRLGKRKCRPGKSNSSASCARCEKMRISCSLSLSSKPERSPSSAARHNTTSNDRRQDDDSSSNASTSHSVSFDPQFLDPLWKQEMVNHYFDVVHDKHHSLFHRPLFETELHQNKIADVILCAVLSLGSRFSSTPQQHGNRFAEKAYRSLDMREASVTTIQGCILLGTLCYVDGRSEAEAMYYATALRLALILNLPQRPCATQLEHQVNLRVWWTLYMIDIWSSAGLRLPRQLDFREDVELPFEESQFLELSPNDGFDTEQSYPMGIWGQMARLTQFWSEIQDLNRASVDQQLSPMSLTEQIDELSQKLDSWKHDLPPFLEETEENLMRAAAIGQGPSFAALHLGFHYYHEVLFFAFMAESHQCPSPIANSYADHCAEHAQAFCDLLYLCEQKEDCKCLYAMVGHMLVVTSTVFMHMLLVSDNGSDETHAAQIRKRLGHNFEILTELQHHWATLDTSLSRLKVFHNACLFSIENSFNMDRWMLRFILEHGSSMPEKFTLLPDGTTQVLVGGEDAFTNSPGRTLQDWYSQTLS